MMDNFKKEFDKGMPVITYVKKKFSFSSVEEFESYIEALKEKADKYDRLMEEKNS